MCLAHFEADQAAGGNLYAKFARCYLQLAGAQPNQPSSKPKAEGALFSEQVCCLLTHLLLFCKLYFFNESAGDVMIELR